MANLLEVDGLTAGYGGAVVLENLSINLARGQSLAVLGRNGVGKTTLLETLMGNTRVVRGTIRLNGKVITGMPPHRRSRLGLGWVPQEREIFPSLTVTENLTVIARPGPWNLNRVYAIFPRLRERARNYGNQLSGGEQQMLSIARALMTNPTLLLLDEPMEGLAPIIVAELSAAVCEMCDQEGLQSIIVEQRPIIALAMSQQVIVLERGAAVHTGCSAELTSNRDLLSQLLGVGKREPNRQAGLVNVQLSAACGPFSGSAHLGELESIKSESRVPLNESNCPRQEAIIDSWSQISPRAEFS